MNERETIRLLISNPPDHKELGNRLKALLARDEQEGFYLHELHEIIDGWHDEAWQWCAHLSTIISRARTFTRWEKAEIDKLLAFYQSVYEQARLEIRTAVNAKVIQILCQEDDDPGYC